MPSCSSADIKAERHDFSWEVICDSIGIASVTSPVETFLCNQHYQQVYRLLNAKSEACRTCGVKRRHVHSATVSTVNFVTCADPKRVESFLKDNIEFSDTIREGDQICYTCYKFINQILNSDVCMLSRFFRS